MEERLQTQTKLAAYRAAGSLAEPNAAEWQQVPGTRVGLLPIPLEAQPTEYIRVAWRERPYGRVREIDVRAAHNGDRLFVRVAWRGSGGVAGEFPDAAGVLFPRGKAAVEPTIGAPTAPVDLHWWRADGEGVVCLEARGPGVFRRLENLDGATAAGAGHNGDWVIVFSRLLDGSWSAGTGGRLGIVVWDGSNDERAGIGAVTPEWVALAVEA